MYSHLYIGYENAWCLYPRLGDDLFYGGFLYEEQFEKIGMGTNAVKKILIISASETSSTILENIFSKYKCHIQHEKNLENSLHAITMTKPDVVILNVQEDCSLPLELLKEIRKNVQKHILILGILCNPVFYRVYQNYRKYLDNIYLWPSELDLLYSKITEDSV